VNSRDALSALLRGEIVGSGRTQTEVAADVGISQKHLSGIVNGKVSGFGVADAILAACGRRLVLATVPLDGDR
jgi:hypothetical protein